MANKDEEALELQINANEKNETGTTEAQGAVATRVPNMSSDMTNVDLTDGNNNNSGNNTTTVEVHSDPFGSGGNNVIVSTGTIIDENVIKEISSPTFSSKLKMLCCPIQSFKNIEIKEENTNIIDTATHIIIIPESLRMIAYINFIFIICLSILVSSVLVKNVDYFDNDIRNYFGFSNLCIYFDGPPMMYITPFWYCSLVFLPMFSFLILDNFRIYDRYKDSIHLEYNTITKRFYKFYSCGTIFIGLAFMALNITFAITPDEQIQIHTYPFLCVMFAWWILSIQRIIYWDKVGMWDRCQELHSNGGKYEKFFYSKKFVRLLAYINVTILTVTVLSLFILNGPWSGDFGEWTDVYSEYADKVMSAFVLVVPVLSYFFLTDKMEIIEIVINRKSNL